MAPLPDIARASCARHSMLTDGAVAVAMVSGGADSTALVRLLAAEELGPLDLSVLHVDHMLRGSESRADADFVADTCATLGVPCRVVRYDVSAYAQAEGLNLEDAGRRVRYRFAEEELDARCDKAGTARTSGRIATAHTLDDTVETFLMRAMSGAGAGGLSGVPPVRGRVVRPLIDVTRAQVTAYLEELGQRWREDATNADASRLRSRVRHEVVPALSAVEPAFRENLSRSLRLLAEEDALLSDMADAFARDFARLDADGVLVFDRGLMRTLSRPMARRVLRSAILGAFAESSRLESSHTEALVDGLSEDSFARDLPEGLRAEVEYGTMRVSRPAPDARSLAPCLLEWPGVADLGDAGRIEAVASPPAPIPDDPGEALIDASRLAGPLVVDSPRDGDRMVPLGMSGTRKLQDVLVDAKVPRRARAQTPVVRDGDRVVWVAGVRLSEEYKVGPDTESAVLLRYTGPDEDGPDGGLQRG